MKRFAVLLALAAALLAAILYVGIDPERAASGGAEAPAASRGAAAATPETPADAKEALDGARTAAETRAAPATHAGEETVVVRGRLLLEGTSASPRAATVSVRAGAREIDSPETWKRLLEGPDADDAGEDPARDHWRALALGGWKPVASAVAGADGRFELRVPASMRRFGFHVDADDALYVRGEGFSLDDERLRSGVTLWMRPAGRIEGKLTTARGEPVADGRVVLAAIRWHFGERVTFAAGDATGRFLVRAIPFGEYEVAAVGRGCGPTAKIRIAVGPGEACRPVLVLPPEAAVRGRIVDRGGKPFPGARVSGEAEGPSSYVIVGWSALPTAETRSGPDGRFRLGSLRPLKHTITVEPKGRVVDTRLEPVDLATGGEVDVGDVVVGSGDRVAGRVVDGLGRGVEGAGVNVGPSAAPRRRTRTGPDGKFDVEGLKSPPYVLVAATADHLSSAVIQVAGGADQVVLVLGGSTGIAGTVRDAKSRVPLPRFTVAAKTASRGEGRAGWRLEATKSFDSPTGAFEILGLTPGRYALDVWSDESRCVQFGEYDLKEREVLRDVEILLPPAVIVRGRVVQGSDGTPVPGASVKFRTADWRRDGDAWSGPDGTFEVRVGGGDRGSLRAIHELHGSALTTIDAPASGTADAGDMKIARSGSIEGSVLEADGKPLAGVVVMAGPEDNAFDESGWARPAADGSFRVAGIRPGRVHVSVLLDDVPRHGARLLEQRLPEGQRVVVEPDRATRVEIRALKRDGATLRGRVTLAGRPSPGARISVFPARRGARGPRFETLSRWMANADTSGRYEIDGVPDGPARVRVTCFTPGSERADSPTMSVRMELETSIPRAPSAELDLALPAGEIRGRALRRGTKAPVADAAVTSFPSDATDVEGGDPPAVTRTEVDGSFRVQGLSSGRYRVTIVPRPESECASANLDGIEVADGTTTVDVELPSPGSARIELLNLEGQPITEGYAWLVPAPGDANGRASGSWQSDSDGIAIARSVAPGRYYARTNPRGGAAAALSEFADVREGEETRFVVRLVPGTALRVHPRDGEGTLVEWAQVDLADAHGRWLRARSIDEDRAPGEKAATAIVAPGRWTVRARADGFRTAEVALDVGDAAQSIQIPLQPLAPAK